MSRSLTKVASTYQQEWFQAEPDIFVVIPEPGYKDSLEAARVNSEMVRTLARDQGRRCGFVIVMSHHISQGAEAREVYARGLPQELIYGVALVAENPLARAISSFYLGFSKPSVTIRIVDSVDAGISWLESIRET